MRNEGKFVHVDYPPGNTLSVGPQTFPTEVGPPSFTLGTSDRRGKFCCGTDLVHGHADGRLVVVALLFRLGEPSPVVQGVLDAAPGRR